MIISPNKALVRTLTSLRFVHATQLKRSTVYDMRVTEVPLS